MSDDRIYHHGMRTLQDKRKTRALADRLIQVIMHERLTPEDAAFIRRCAMCFIATADEQGRPDCSYKGGLPGFIQVIDEKTLAIPDYDGNGMYRSWGNVLVNPEVGLLFIDFENPGRMRINGTARIDDSDPLLSELPGAVFIVRITVTNLFPNCSRYVHEMTLNEHSVYAPRPEYTPPEPEWKSHEEFVDALPEKDRTDK